MSSRSANPAPDSEIQTVWTIDELAGLVGLPTRTIREYRTLGLVSPPVMAGRVGTYNRAHRSRLELIGRLQTRGYSLAAIGDLCNASATGRSLEEVLGASAASGIDEPAIGYTLNELVVVAPAFGASSVRSAACTAGLLTRRGNRWVARSPALLMAFAELTAAGAHPDAVLAMVAGMVEGARQQANAVGDLVVESLWPQRDGLDAEFVNAARRLRLLLTQAVGSLFADAAGEALRARSNTPGGQGLKTLVDRIQIGALPLDARSAPLPTKTLTS